MNTSKQSQKNLQVQEEWLDIVDQNDQVIKSLPRSQVYGENLCHQMRAVWLFLKNEKGELWIARRSANKKIDPSCLEGSAVGHVQAGETYEQAMIRETQEELGLDVSKLSYRYVGKVTPHEHKAFCFCAVYEVTVDLAPDSWNRDDFQSFQWMKPQDLLHACNDGEKFKSTLPIILQQLYHCK